MWDMLKNAPGRLRKRKGAQGRSTFSEGLPHPFYIHRLGSSSMLEIDGDQDHLMGSRKLVPGPEEDRET